MTLWIGNGAILKGGYLDFLQFTELKIIYVTEIYMKKKKQYKSLIIKSQENIFLIVFP